MTVQQFRGGLYRSKVEVAWAMMFVLHEFEFIYEPFKLDLVDETGKAFKYVPDFYVPEQRILLEVKNQWLVPGDERKWVATAKLLEKSFEEFQVVSGPPWSASNLYFSSQRRLAFDDMVSYRARSAFNNYQWPEVSFSQISEFDVRFSKLKVVSMENIASSRGETVESLE